MNTVTFYSKKSCPFCVRAEQLLQHKGILNMNKIAVDEDHAELATMMARSGRRSVPQIFIGDTHVGGFDELAELERSGTLDTLLNN